MMENLMENQAVNGVLDLGVCNPPSGKLILPFGTTITPTSSEHRMVPNTPAEEPKAKYFAPGEWTFEKEHGFAPPKPVGPYMVVQLYTQKLSDIISITAETRSGQRWISNVGRVINLGSACFKGEQFKDWDESDFPKIGDWITYKVNSGPTVKFRGIDIVIMFDDAMNMKLEDPEHITRD
jgi:hypothetical protein